MAWARGLSMEVPTWRPCVGVGGIDRSTWMGVMQSGGQHPGLDVHAPPNGPSHKQSCPDACPPFCMALGPESLGCRRLEPPRQRQTCYRQLCSWSLISAVHSHWQCSAGCKTQGTWVGHLRSLNVSKEGWADETLGRVWGWLTPVLPEL